MLRLLAHMLVGLFEIAAGLFQLINIVFLYRDPVHLLMTAEGALLVGLSLLSMVAGGLLLAGTRLGVLLSVALQLLQLAVVETQDYVFGLRLRSVSFNVTLWQREGSE
jgi:hypothetical protein